VEGTSGAVTRIPFREGVHGAALKSKPGFGLGSQVDSFEIIEAELPQGRQ